MSIFPGCLAAYRFPEYEKSTSLVLGALGMPPVFVDSFTCCGGTMLAFDEQVGMELGSLRYGALEKSGAQAVITACPNCHSVYHVYSKSATGKSAAGVFRLPPAMFITQFLGLSMGMTFSDMCLDRHMDRKALSELLG